MSIFLFISRMPLLCCYFSKETALISPYLAAIFHISARISRNRCLSSSFLFPSFLFFILFFNIPPSITVAHTFLCLNITTTITAAKIEGPFFVICCRRCRIWQRHAIIERTTTAMSNTIQISRERGGISERKRHKKKKMKKKKKEEGIIIKQQPTPK